MEFEPLLELEKVKRTHTKHFPDLQPDRKGRFIGCQRTQIEYLNECEGTQSEVQDLQTTTSPKCQRMPTELFTVYQGKTQAVEPSERQWTQLEPFSYYYRDVEDQFDDFQGLKRKAQTECKLTQTEPCTGCQIKDADLLWCQFSDDEFSEDSEEEDTETDSDSGENKEFQKFDWGRFIECVVVLLIVGGASFLLRLALSFLDCKDENS